LVKIAKDLISEYFEFAFILRIFIFLIFLNKHFCGHHPKNLNLQFLYLSF